MSLSQRRPQEGMPITATLSDKDGNVSKTKWQWYRGNSHLGVNEDGEIVVVGATAIADANVVLNTAGKIETTTTTDGVVTVIADGCDRHCGATVRSHRRNRPCPYGLLYRQDATSSTYIPVAADATGGGDAKPFDDAPEADGGGDLQGRSLGVRGRQAGATPDIAIATSEQDAVVRPTSNARPRFLDKGPVERERGGEREGCERRGPGGGASDTDPLLYDAERGR